MTTSVSPRAWKERGQSARLLGHRIFWVDSRAGDESSDLPVVLLIHGFPTSSWDWVPLWASLSQTHRLIALDLLGFGFSDKPRPHRYSIVEQADVCEALVRHCGLSTFHVLAHDYGDTVAQELLARQNEGGGAGRWRSLCLLNGGLFPEMHRPRLIQKLLLTPLGPLVSRLLSRRAFGRAFSEVFGPQTQPSEAELDRFWELIELNGGKRLYSSLIRYIPERVQHRERWVGALSDAEVPIALINGSLDPVSGAHMVAHFRKTLGSDHFIVELGTVGHYPQVEDPSAVLDAYRSFLAGIE